MKLGMPIYKLMTTTGPSHKPEFQIEISIADHQAICATGNSKKVAEQAAAKILIAELSQLQKNNSKGKKNDNRTK